MGSLSRVENCDTLGGQLERFLRTWEPSLAQEFLRYDRLLRAKARRPLFAWGQEKSGPYWQELPRWLAEREGYGRDAASGEFLDTVIWGQTSLFYAIRLQDDQLDGQLPHSSLRLAPLLFLSEADRAYSSVIEAKADFWHRYRRALQTTLSGIASVARMQRNTAMSTEDLLQNYGGVDAIFSVGSSAVCERTGREEHIPRIEEFVSQLGKVLLALDDLNDIGEDLEDGRLNYAARMLLDVPGAGDSNPALLATSWHELVRPEGLDGIRKELCEGLERAAAAITCLQLQPAMDLIASVRAQVHDLSVAPPAVADH